MKRLVLLVFALGSLSACSQNNNVLPAKIQIKTALMAAPKMLRDKAKVLGYDKNGELVTLRKGTNEMVCLADDPNKDGISVACYSKELEPFMARGRELVQKGKKGKEERKIRKKEIDSGELKMPSEPAMLYVVSGQEDNYNKKTGELKNSSMRYVLYKPYMTGESTGLPTKPQAPGMPWLMDANTHRSHIMITPAQPEK